MGALYGGVLLPPALLLLAAIGAMNGLMKTDEVLADKTPNGWREHRLLRVFHHITGEGELAGIFVGVVAIAVLAFTGHAHHIHIAYAAGLTLLGVMSAASLAKKYMTPILAGVEHWFGIRMALIVGSLLGSLTGEPASAVFQTDYLKGRVRPENAARVATGLAAAIGSGGGLLPFSAPPVLIVWDTLRITFGWGIPELLSFVGVGCVLHVVVSVLRFVHLVEAPVGDRPRFESRGILPLMMLSLLILAHVISPCMLLYGVDAFVGAVSWWQAHQEYSGCEEEKKEEAFTAKWQPLMLGVLLCALEIIGGVTDPLIAELTKLIPADWPLLAVAILLFFATAWVSHVADNALASRAFIGVPVFMIPTIGVANASLLAAAVLMGAVFGGFLTLPANLPNFKLARELGVKSGPWFIAALSLYFTAVVYVVWLVVRSLF